jgi:hypothetical protein
MWSCVSDLARLLKSGRYPYFSTLKQESGWDMTATKNKNGSYTARVIGNTSLARISRQDDEPSLDL